MLNKDLFRTVRAEFKPGGEVMVMDKLDDYTVRFQFAAPNPTMIIRFGDQIGLRRKNGAMLAPAHYLKQFHIKHNPKANELAKERGFDDWSQLFLFEFSTEQDETPNLSYPWLEPWVQTDIDDVGNKFYERNPYYFKVDSAGQQLPYLDRNVLILVESQEVVALKTIAGEADVSSFALTLQNWPLYKENEERGDYRALLWDSARMEMVFHFNHTSQDPVLRKIFNDVRFKGAVSLAIDREDINKTVFHGEADQGQATPPPSNPYVKDWMVNYMVEHDPDRANELLDEMGLRWDAERKWRLRPDGKRLSLIYQNYRKEGPKWPIAELTKTYLEDIGIEMTLKELTSSMNYQTKIANEHEMTGHHYDEGDFPRGWVSHAMAELQPHRHWAPAWMLWKSSGGEKGEEPPPEMKELQNMVDQWLVTPLYTPESERLANEILTRNTKNLYQIGAGGRAPQPVIVKNGLVNVPDRDSFWPEGAWFYNTAPGVFLCVHMGLYVGG
jgi:peptide/nickel transport system substrate-binding protein